MEGRKKGRPRDGRAKPRPGIEQQRRLIVEASTALFAERASAAVSVLEICAAADISRPTFYRCFANKEELLAYVYEIAVDRYVDQIVLRELPVSGDIEAWIWQAVDRIVDGVLEQPAMARFVFVEYGDPTSPVRDLINDAFARSAEVLVASIHEVYGDSPSRLYLKSLMASVQWTLFETLRAGPTAARRREAKLAIWQINTAAYRFLRRGDWSPVGTTKRPKGNARPAAG